MNGLKRNLLSNYYTTTVITVVLVKLTFSLKPSETASSSSSSYQHDYLCNNGTKFACVCYRKDDSLTPYYHLCNHFFGVEHLPVVKAVLTEVELTNNDIRFNESAYENYENYFKRRVVAKILNRYCPKDSKNTNCQGTDHAPVEAKDVVVLKVECGERKGESVIRYVVAQNYSEDNLTPNNTMDPENVVNILNETLFMKRSRNVLGLAKLVEHKPDVMIANSSFFKPPIETYPNEGFTKFLETTTESSNGDDDYFARNMAFFVIIIVLGVIVAIIYIIAIIKAISDRRKQLNRIQEREKKADQPTNYGATGDNQPQSAAGATTVVLMSSSSSKIRIPVTVSQYSNLNEPVITNNEKQPPPYSDISQGNLMTPSSSYVRVLINQPPPAATNFDFFLRKTGKSKKSTSTENLISQSNSPVVVKKSKTVHEIQAHNNEVCENSEKFDEFEDNKLIIQPLCGPEIRIEIVESSPVEHNDYEGKYCDSPTPDYPEKSDFITNDDNDDDVVVVNKGGSSFAVDGSKEAGALLTLSQTEENLLSDVSSLNEFSTESEDDSDLTSDYNSYQRNQPIASYKPLKESNWSINRAAICDEDIL